MREILFRGKNKLNGAWFCGDLRNYENSKAKAIFSHEHLFRVEVDPNTVGQFTGMTDNNGKWIYEGDILKFSYAGKNKGVEGMETVVFKNGKFGVEWGWHRELVALDGFANTTMEVIGNIHDNPELLEGNV